MNSSKSSILKSYPIPSKIWLPSASKMLRVTGSTPPRIFQCRKGFSARLLSGARNGFTLSSMLLSVVSLITAPWYVIGLSRCGVSSIVSISVRMYSCNIPTSFCVSSMLSNTRDWQLTARGFACFVYPCVSSRYSSNRRQCSSSVFCACVCAFWPVSYCFVSFQ